MRDRLPPNALGSLYMTLGALAYVVNDGLVRAATEAGLDVYQALFFRGCGMVVVFWTISRVRNQPLAPRRITRPLAIRVGAEVVGTSLFFAALIHLDFANAQTILMLVPFAVTLVAAHSLKEHVTARRYLAVAVGFLGVLAVIRPTPDAFSPWSLVVLVSAAALTVRELATRRIERAISPVPIALLTAIAITSMMGLISLFTGWGTITGEAMLLIVLAGACLIAGYLFAIETVRVGDLSVSAPFRYTAVVGAVVVGLAMFGESPGALTLLGCTLIVGAGIVTARSEALQPARP